MSWNRSERRVEFSKAQKRIILRRDRNRCYLCGGPAIAADHVVPIAEGGPNDLSNGRAICSGCHEAKSRAESARGYQRRMERSKLPPEPHPFYDRKKTTDGE